MAAITIQDVGAAGLASATFAAATAGGDTIAYGTKQMAGYEQYSVLLLVKNAAGATQDITVGSLAAVTCPATTGFSIIPVPNEGLNDPSVAVTYSAVVTLTVAAVRILP